MKNTKSTDAYFSADVETDGPIPGPYSMLSFGLVYAGQFDGQNFERPADFEDVFYTELRPISETYEEEALSVNKLNRQYLVENGNSPADAMNEANKWIEKKAAGRNPVLVAYPLAFDWTWLYWYFTAFSSGGSLFGHSQCYDIKTAFASKAELPIGLSGRSRLPIGIRSLKKHTHHAVDDAIEQAEIFANLFEWKRKHERI